MIGSFPISYTFQIISHDAWIISHMSGVHFPYVWGLFPIHALTPIPIIGAVTYGAHRRRPPGAPKSQFSKVRRMGLPGGRNVRSACTKVFHYPY